jgi:hypothetical protein
VGCCELWEVSEDMSGIEAGGKTLALGQVVVCQAMPYRVAKKSLI